MSCPRESLYLTVFSHFNLLLFPLWFTLFFKLPPPTKPDGLPDLDKSLGSLQRMLVPHFLPHDPCNLPVQEAMKGSRFPHGLGFGIPLTFGQCLRSVSLRPRSFSLSIIDSYIDGYPWSWWYHDYIIRYFEEPYMNGLWNHDQSLKYIHLPICDSIRLV